jgi:hypothetical protein
LSQGEAHVRAWSSSITPLCTALTLHAPEPFLPGRRLLIGSRADTVGLVRRRLTLRRIQTSMRSGGMLSEEEYTIDGWELGYIFGMGSGDIAVGTSLEETLRNAIAGEMSTATGS